MTNQIFDNKIRPIEWFIIFPTRFVLAAVGFVLSSFLYLTSLPMKPIVAGIGVMGYWAGEKPSEKWLKVTVISLVISILMLFLFFEPWVALAVIASIWFHEHSHGVGYKEAGTDYYLLFLGPLGAAAVCSDTDYAAMNQWSKFKMLAMGPCGSIIVALTFILLSVAIPQEATKLLMLASLNGTLVLFNMIALGGLDGGRMYTAIMESLPERKEKYVALPMIVISVVALLIAFWISFRFELPLFFLLMILAGYVRSALKDDVTAAFRKTAMTTRQVGYAVVVYLVELIIGLILYAKLPDFLGLFKISPLITENIPVLLSICALLALGVLSYEVVYYLKERTNFIAFGAGAVYSVLLGCVISFVAHYLSMNNVGLRGVVFVTAISFFSILFSLELINRWKQLLATLRPRVQHELYDIYSSED